MPPGPACYPAPMEKLSPGSAQCVYLRAQQLLKVAHRCEDDDAADEVQRIAHALLEIAYQEDDVVAIEGGSTALN
jgi:hypothetical protein